MIDFGSEATSQRVGNAEITNIKKFHNGEQANLLKHYKVRVKVGSSKHEMTEFINFTRELSELRDSNRLVIDKDDPATRPAFIFEYPKDSKDGSHFIIKCFTIQG